MKKLLSVLFMSMALMACSDSDKDDNGGIETVDIDQATSIKMVNFKFDTSTFSGTFVLENDQGVLISGAANYKVMVLGEAEKPKVTAFKIPWHHAELYQCGVVDGQECRGELKETSKGHYTFNPLSEPGFGEGVNRIRVSVSIVGLLAETAPKLI